MRLGAFIATLLAFSIAFASFLGSAATSAAPEAAQGSASSPGKPNSPGLDFGFMENRGQWDDRALFFAGSPGVDVWVTKEGIVYDFYRQEQPKLGGNRLRILDPGKREGHVVALEFEGTNPYASGEGAGQRDGLVHFIQAQQSTSNVRLFNESRVNQLYRGIDLRVYRDSGYPRFDLIVNPGADPNQVQFRYQGAASVRPAGATTIMVGTQFGEVSVTGLYAFQWVNGVQKQVDCAFVVNPDGSVRFNVGAYDPSRQLIIDPVVYSTLLGGPASGAGPGTDLAFGVDVDQLNFAYVTGATNTPIFPTTQGAYSNQVRSYDAFVTKFAVDAKTLVFSTFVGGAGVDQGLSIAVDRAGRPVIGGWTGSVSSPPQNAFPTTPDAFQSVYGGGPNDGFLARLSADGSQLTYGTYIGGTTPTIFTDGDGVNGVGVDFDDNMYAVGETDAPNFPVTSTVLQSLFGGGLTDGFAFRVSANGVTDYSTYIGGQNSDTASAVVVDDIGNAHITGSTNSTNFPTTPGAFRTIVQQSDAFVGKLAPTGTHFIYCTTIGGSANESAASIALDTQGNAYICGATSSVDFPRTPGAFDDIFNPEFENFVTKVAIDGASLVYSTFMNGGGTQTGIAVDDLGVAHISGYVLGPGITTTPTGDDTTYNGPPPAPGRIGDAYVQALNDAGTALIYGSYFGGEEDDAALGIAIDRSRNAYVVGVTNSWTQGNKVPFPTTPGVFKEAMSNDNIPNLPFWDAFLMKIKVRPAPLLTSVVITPNAVAGTERTTATVNLTTSPSPGGAVVRITSSNLNVARPVVPGTNTPLDEIFIDEGQTSGTFEIETSDVVQSFVVTFTAELEGDTKVGSLTVAPWLTNLILSPNSIVGGNGITARVNLFRPAAPDVQIPGGQMGMVLGVTTSNPSIAFAWDAVNNRGTNQIYIPAGETTTTFEIRTRGVDATTNVTVLTRIQQRSLSVTRSQILQVTPATLQSVSFFPQRVNVGEKSTGTVRLNGEAGPTPIQVNLTLGTGAAPITLSSNQVTIAAQTREATFEATAGYIGDNAFRNVIATRVGGGGESRQGTLFVDTNDLMSVDLSQSSVLGGGIVTGHVTVRHPAAASGMNLVLQITPQNSPYARFQGAQSNGSITVRVEPGAIRSETFTIITSRTLNTPKVINVRAFQPTLPTRVVDRNLTIRPINFTFTMSPNQVVGGTQNVTGTITLNEAAHTNGVEVFLKSMDTTALTVPNSVIVPEGQTTVNFTATSVSVQTSKTVDVIARIDTADGPLLRSASATINPLNITVTLNPDVVTGGSQTSTGTVTIPTPAGPGGLHLALTSENTAAARTPGQVIIPEGQFAASFTITTSYVAQDQGAWIQARTASGATGRARLTVLALRVGVLVQPKQVLGGNQNATGTVTLSHPAGPSGFEVPLSSSNPAVARVPSFARIAQGGIAVNFGVQSFKVAVDTQVTITATLPSGRTGQDTITVMAPRITELRISPDTVVGGTSTAGRVTLNTSPPTGGVKVDLTSSNPSLAQVPASITVPAGTNTQTFTVTTNAVATQQQVTITATFAGQSRSATLTLLAPNLVALTINPSTVVGGQNTTGTVYIDRVAPAGGITVQILKDPNATGSQYVSFPEFVTIPAGQSQASFTITTQRVSRTVATQLYGVWGERGQQVSATLTLVRD
jgi:hypothetical protein